MKDVYFSRYVLAIKRDTKFLKSRPFQMNERSGYKYILFEIHSKIGSNDIWFTCQPVEGSESAI